ncbi:MAG: hypothetical protein AB1941_02315 [Gemmatimonadota bacterium]
MAPTAGLALLLSAPASLGAAAVCSPVPYHMNRRGDETYYIATATADTLPVPPGNPHAAGYGQVFLVQDAGGADAASLRPRGKQAVARVVLVPTASCSDGPWPGSARWLEPGTTGFFASTVWPRDRWAAGIPTAFGDNRTEPYPHAIAIKSGIGNAPDSEKPALTPTEYRTLYEALPYRHEESRDRERSLERLRRWRQDNPLLAARFPATFILRIVLGPEATGGS